MKLLNTMIPVLVMAGISSAEVTFSWKEMLGRASDNGVTVNAVPDQAAEIFFEYGTAPGSYTLSTDTLSVGAGEVAETIMGGCAKSTQYFYRMRYRDAGSSAEFSAGNEYRFHTARNLGEPYTFVIQADQHMDAATDSLSFVATQNNILKDSADFMVDLGDCFLSEKYGKGQDTLFSRLKMARGWYDNMCHSLPLNITIGNHEGELGWLNNGTDTCFAVRAAKTRTTYYPNPFPNSFYTGDDSETPFIGKRESWYSWEWGNALYVVLDPYWNAKKDKTHESGWGFTLGDAQYNWLKTTLRGSSAKFKFVFVHQLVGGDEPFDTLGKTLGTGRGGAAWAHLYEMGGYTKATGANDFATMRPGWEKPLHDLFVETGVNIYFHGHDHMFAMEEKDGVIYQECPQPGLAQYKTAGNAAAYGYGNATSLIANSGHLRVKVDADSAVVQYIRSFKDGAATGDQTNGMTAFSYTLGAKATSVAGGKSVVSEPLTLTVSGEKSVTLNYSIPQAGHVALTLMDLRGRLINRVVDENLAAGMHSFTWDSRGQASGIYVAMLNANGMIKTARIAVK